MTMPSNDYCEKKAAELGFDLTKQFITLAFGGIAFLVGLSYSTPTAVTKTLLWLVISIFGVSACLGLLFLMRGVNQLSEQKSFDIYNASLRLLSKLQIVTMVAGTVLLAVMLGERKATDNTHVIEVKTDSKHSVRYPLDPLKSISVEINGSAITITAK
jgi:hypothetical protein